jgi:DNA-3-methyladenine glycosylase I
MANDPAKRAARIEVAYAARVGSQPQLQAGDDGRLRCGWAAGDELYRTYHDVEWGRALHDERALFELLCLEGFQAGLAWITILRKRPAFRAAFADFEPEILAAWTDADVARLLTDTGIVRHRGKITATLANARALVAMHAVGESLDRLCWSFAPASHPRPASLTEVPASTAEATALSRALRDRGFRFVGPITVYAFMQSAGIVDDHLAACWRSGR